ncbi:aerolysin-like protein [Hemibagrus wyckioides]|uniref:aerolysin-like protein n=1 Tax=Hemibagrus wyckioides TaxID=337641 RepID=UPI00266B8060|nr:aerolysin-like protein [Hemibagrus wyckioides]
MSCLLPVLIIGGNRGGKIDFRGTRNGATLRKIWVWAGGWQIKAIKVWLADGQSEQFGEPAGKFSQFEFEDGEHFTSLSLWGNGAGTRLGAIKFKTNRSREFFAQMTDWRLKTEYPVDVGSGICMGISGRSGADIDSLGFIFIKPIKSAKLINVQYPTLHSVIPNVAVEEIRSITYQNNSSEIQEHTLETSKTITKKSSWSVANKMETFFKMDVRAGIPEVVDVSAGFGLTEGRECSFSLENTEEKTERLTALVKVPPRKTMTVNITISRATVDLPYTGTVQITCYDSNHSVMEIDTSGIYRGLSYTDAKVTMNESSNTL